MAGNSPQPGPNSQGVQLALALSLPIVAFAALAILVMSVCPVEAELTRDVLIPVSTQDNDSQIGFVRQVQPTSEVKYTAAQ
ncbi:uncharacterized protein N7498_008918 [Penicillium cinerascens]|uniref:Transmembrane protein n=1 Tax=Penicillium cinerascens TaxID=70096 RepID=A0A9W9JIE0_9EURO|nr:uncharacterized protein N7498_008918 [Penicillium cinerascens]KAJ5195480.1 hypothetical protein N7498_008918 [Penicillium cinerascens]